MFGLFSKAKGAYKIQKWAQEMGATQKGCQEIGMYLISGYSQCPQCRDIDEYTERFKWELEWSLGTYLYDLSDDWDRGENDYAWENIQDYQLDSAANGVNMAYLVGGPRSKEKYTMTVKEYVESLKNRQ